MKFEESIDINVPVDKVVALFNDPDRYKDWQNGFISYETISGKPRTAGAVSVVKYKNGRHNIELTETIRVMNPPAEITGLYEHKHGSNTMINTFTALPGDITRYTTAVGYMKPKGFLPTLMAFLMPGMMKKRNRQWLEQFKAFAENEYQRNNPA